MNLNQINEEIKKCNEDPFLNPEQKKMRLTILKATLKKVDKENTIKQLISEYQMQVAEFLRITNGKVKLSSDIEQNQQILKDYILSSEIFESLEVKKNVPFNYLKLEIWDHSCTHDKDLKDLKKAVMICELIELIKSNEKNKIFLIALNLSEVVEKSVISRTKKVIKLEDGEVKTNETMKTKEEYDKYRGLAKDKLKQLCEEKKLLDPITLNYGLVLIDDIFNSYDDDLKIVEIIENPETIIGKQK